MTENRQESEIQTEKIQVKEPRKIPEKLRNLREKLSRRPGQSGQPPLLYLIPLGIMASLLLAFSLSHLWEKAGKAVQMEYDKKAKSSEEAEKSAVESQLEGQLEDSAEKGNVHIRIYSETAFPEGTLKPGNTIIQNPPDSGGAIQVEIVLKDSGETVYKSEKLKEGASLYKLRLNRELNTGIHEAAAKIHVFDKEGKKETGGFSTDMKLIVGDAEK